MNKLSARSVAFLNGFIAFVIIVVGTMLGTVELHVLDLVTGAILGFIVALIVCGLIALFIEMHDELVKYAGRWSKAAATPVKPCARADPADPPFGEMTNLLTPATRGSTTGLCFQSLSA